MIGEESELLSSKPLAGIFIRGISLAQLPHEKNETSE